MVHSFADDSQVYHRICIIPAAAVQQFTKCVELIDQWMQCNGLKLNTDKTQLIWMGIGRATIIVEVNISQQDLPTKGQQFDSLRMCRTWVYSWIVSSLYVDESRFYFKIITMCLYGISCPLAFFPLRFS